MAVALLLVGGGAANADDRGYELHNKDAKKPAPLIVALQCYGCPPTFVPKLLGLEELARRHNALLAIPVALSDRNGNPFWNATPACCDFDGRKPDDVAYIVRVIDDAVARYGADPRQVYLVGSSNGGFLAHRIACERSEKIAAIVSVGGAAPETCKPSSPVAVLEVHGRNDDVVPVDGGKLGAGLPQRAPIPSARAALEVWARIDGCGAADANGRRRCKRGAADLWLMPGGHVPDLEGDFAEHLWQWLAGHRK
ncbi:MAG: alpha/beta hydrolase family esterase [Polyangia bacterium]